MKSKIRNLWDWRKLFKKQRKEYKQLQRNYLEYRCKVIRNITDLEYANSELQKQLAMRDAIINILTKDPAIRLKFLNESLVEDFSTLSSPRTNYVVVGSKCKVELEFPTNWTFPKVLK